MYSKEGNIPLTLQRLLFSGLNYLTLLYELKEIQSSNLHRIISSNLFWQAEIAGIQSLCFLALLICSCCMAQSIAQNRVYSHNPGNFLLLIP